MTANAAKSTFLTGNKSLLMTEQAHDALIARLRDGTLPSGTFLSMPMLVELLGLPLAAVREAVKRAEASGLVNVLPKRGLQVMDAGPDMTRECLELRAIFDMEGAKRLIARRDDIPLAALRAAHERLRDEAQGNMAIDLPQRAIATDVSLHDALARGLGSSLAGRLYEENRNRIAIIQNTRPFLPDRIASAMDEHLAIIDALENGEAEKIEAEIRTHLTHTLRWWGIMPRPLDTDAIPT